jgi:DNA mismatch repair protein MutS
MLAQYQRIKQTHRDEVLFFRLGDFYEMFGDDALEVSSLLNLTLTSRNNLPMCGVPCHSATSYIARLLKSGKKIAICEQLGEHSKIKGKTLIEREVVEVITPGTTVDDDYLESGASNYLAALFDANGALSFAYIDLSTGEFCATTFLENHKEQLRRELERLEIREILVQESLVRENPLISQALEERESLLVNRWADWLFDAEKSIERLSRQFGTKNLKGFGINRDSPEVAAAGALLDYLDETTKNRIPHVRNIRIYNDMEFAGIDESSMRNMELFRNQHDGSSRFSLFEVLDKTRTSMGKRMLKHRLAHPLMDRLRIEKRLTFAGFFYQNQSLLAGVREILNKTPDLERISSAIAMDKAHGKDLLALKNVLSALKTLQKLIPLECASFFEDAGAHLEQDSEAFQKLMALKMRLEAGVYEEPSAVLNEGKLIKGGFNAELDKLRNLHQNGRNLLEEYLNEEKQATGINGLKIRFNRLIGYYFEVSKIHLGKVPRRFIRRQGVMGGERFTTDRLAEIESDINGAQDKIIEIEKRLFLELRNEAKSLLTELSGAAALISELDVAQSTAEAATEYLWVRPELTQKRLLNIIEGRHPVVESYLPSGEFIPNDVILSAEDAGSASPPAFAMITGPNMAGKSTYLRQAALITIMAQAGFFVPAAKAEIGVTDRIYCRVGASDNISRGESTFLVEMNETACILNTATKYSLVIMDEVGRGTGTKDGLAIAQAVCEDLLNRVKCRTLFATHYHELSALEHPRMANRSLEVDESEGQIIFRRRLVEKPAAESYGLHVARLAGLHDSVVKRAAFLMASMRSAVYVAAASSPEPKNASASAAQTRKAPRKAAEETETPPSLFDQGDLS